MMKNKTNIIIALLGVLLGAVLTLSFSKVWEQKKFDGDYNRWRKLNLILQEVQKNYVDTLDMEASPIISAEPSWLGRRSRS